MSQTVNISAFANTKFPQFACSYLALRPAILDDQPLNLPAIFTELQYPARHLTCYILISPLPSLSLFAKLLSLSLFLISSLKMPFCSVHSATLPHLTQMQWSHPSIILVTRSSKFGHINTFAFFYFPVTRKNYKNYMSASSPFPVLKFTHHIR